MNALKQYSIVIFTANTARQLLHSGEKIIDIKPNKYNRDKTVFVFELSDTIREKIKRNIAKEITNEAKNFRYNNY